MMKKHALREKIRAIEDPANAAFVSKLIPDIDPKTILGVKVPLLRKLAKQTAKEGLADAFLDDLPHRYLEEKLIHVFLISEIRDYSECMKRLAEFLPHMDNWMITDAVRPKVIAAHAAETEPVLEAWLNSRDPYTVRTAIGLYMAYYLGDAFRKEQAERIAALRFDHYYVRMMAAWYMATALVKQPEAVMPLFEEHRMDAWTHNKAIQKASESYRVTEEQKAYLKTLRRKGE